MKRYGFSNESSAGLSGLAGDQQLHGVDESTSRICHRYDRFRSTEPCVHLSEPVAASSGSTLQGKYDVFLSFRGEDTRGSITSYLYAALRRKQIQTFIDNDLRRGDEISPALMTAIEDSKLSVIIFSRNYASSGWCLDELVKILDCKRMKGQIVIPVFYCVDPSFVRHQKGSFGDALAQHAARVQMAKLDSWRVALKEAANLSGWDSSLFSTEAELIEKIVEDVWKKLNRMSASQSLGGLVGIDSHVDIIEHLLCLESATVRSVGIWGMAGIGKTTIAEAVFSRNYPQFDGFHFLSNVREELKRHGAVALWSRFLMDILDEKALNMGTLMSSRLNFMEQRLQYGRFLVVFDDIVDSIPIQFQELIARHHEVFGPGSKILVTSRDKQVLKNLSVDEIYEVGELSFDEAFQVFCFSAFKKTYPSVEHVKHSVKMVKYARGNPLALKIMGASLLDRSEEDWKSVSSELEKVSKPRIMDVLKVGYTGLPAAAKSIFLDIACFFKGENRHDATKVLESCYSSVSFTITTLIDKSLVTISRQNSIMMHDLLQEMGWEIVREECISNPGKRSRLWDPEDIYYVLTSKKGTEAIESMILDISKTNELQIESDAFAGMERLRFLKFWKSEHINVSSSMNNLHIPCHGLQFLSSQLRCLYWEGFPSSSLPSGFCAENLVHLDMPKSNVQTLWTGVQRLVSLKRINLMDSKYLTGIPDISKAQMIEKINLRGCENLRSIPARIDSKFLTVLDLSSCTNIKKCPEISGNMQELYLAGSGIKDLPQSLHMLKSLRLLLTEGLNITKFPEISDSIEELRLSGAMIEEIPSSIESLTRLIELGLSNNKKLSNLPDSIRKLKSLEYLILSGCSNIKRLPDSISKLKRLKILTLDGTAIEDLPSNIHKLGKLTNLDASKIEGVNLLPLVGLNSLTSLHVKGCFPIQICNALWSLTSLTDLNLSDNSFECLPADVKQLHRLRFLNLSNCNRVSYLPEMPQSLSLLSAGNCASLETMSPINSVSLNTLNFANCFKLDQAACCKIMADAVSSFPQVSKRFVYTRADVQMLLPGKEIPEWFSDQAAESSTTIQLPESCHHLNGIAFCVVFELGTEHSSRPNDDLRCVCLAKGSNGDFVSDWDCVLYDTPKRDHVLLWYTFSTTREKLGFSKYSEASFEFSLEWKDKWKFKPVNDYQVRKCGVHLIFQENLIEISDQDGYAYDWLDIDSDEEAYDWLDIDSDEEASAISNSDEEDSDDPSSGSEPL